MVTVLYELCLSLLSSHPRPVRRLRSAIFSETVILHRYDSSSSVFKHPRCPRPITLPALFYCDSHISLPAVPSCG